jgi:sugar phosphate isomerase/epimerase
MRREVRLEVHPTEIAFDIYSPKWRSALDRREEFGFNFDPSHLIWQGVDPVEFIRASRPHLPRPHEGRLGHAQRQDRHPRQPPALRRSRRGWDFRSVGRGGVRFEEIIRALNAVGYPTGPLSVEWEDSGMDREAGARGGGPVLQERRLRTVRHRLRRRLREQLPG